MSGRDVLVEDAFQEACARAEQACVGRVEGEVYNWLRVTTRREIARQRLGACGEAVDGAESGHRA